MYRELVIHKLRCSPVVAKGKNQEMRRQKFPPNTTDLRWKVKVTVRVGGTRRVGVQEKIVSVLAPLFKLRSFMEKERVLISSDDKTSAGHQRDNEPCWANNFTCVSSVSFSGLSETSQCTEYFDRQ